MTRVSGAIVVSPSYSYVTPHTCVQLSIADLTCYRPAHRSRLIYRTIVHRGRKGERRSFSERDYIGLLDAAHQQFHGQIVLVWDNLNIQVSAAMRAITSAVCS